MASVTKPKRAPQSSTVSGARSPIGWTPPGGLDAGGWASAGRRLGAIGRCIQWLLGDWITYGNEKFGNRYAKASKITGYDTQSLMNMVYVASRFSISRRRENLSWSHHEALAALDLEEQEHWLDQAAEHRWSVSDLRMMLRMSRKEAEAESTGSESPEDSDSPVSVVRCPRCGGEVPLAS